MQKLFFLVAVLCSLGAISQPNNGYLSFDGDTNFLEITLKKNIGAIDKTIEFFFETCDNQTSLNKAGLVTFPLEGISVSLTVNASGSAANFHIEKTSNPNATQIIAAPIYRHNSWNHVAICYHAIDSSMSLFFNGDSLGTADSMKVNSSKMIIGSKATTFFKGNIDEVRISDGCIYNSNYPTPNALTASRTTDNLFLLNSAIPPNKFISTGNSVDTATIFGNITFIESTAVTSDTAVCGGDSLTLNADGGSSFKWTSKNFIVNDTLSSPQVYFTISDTLAVRIGNVNGCFLNKSIAVMVNQLPLVNLGNDTTICVGDAILLNGGNFSSYLWSSGATDSIIQTNNDTVWLRVSNSAGCSGADTITIDKYPEIKINLGPDTLLQTGYSIKIEAPDYFARYNWSTGEKTAAILATLPLIYSVTVTDSNGCTATDEISVSYPPASVLENSTGEQIVVYPNPSNGTIRISGTSMNEGPIRFTITDMFGRVITAMETQVPNAEYTFPKDLKSGLYFLSIAGPQPISLPILLQQ